MLFHCLPECLMRITLGKVLESALQKNSLEGWSGYCVGRMKGKIPKQSILLKVKWRRRMRKLETCNEGALARGWLMQTEWRREWPNSVRSLMDFGRFCRDSLSEHDWPFLPKCRSSFLGWKGRGYFESWNDFGSDSAGQLYTEMQENMWDRLCESHAHHGASHAT